MSATASTPGLSVGTANAVKLRAPFSGLVKAKTVIKADGLPFVMKRL